jgi:hypothetical protein
MQSDYNVQGEPVRTIDLGFVSADEYASREKASYWDGRNVQGEPVASGVYFYDSSRHILCHEKTIVVLK